LFVKTPDFLRIHHFFLPLKVFPAGRMVIYPAANAGHPLL
jgi:hypothetical protein